MISTVVFIDLETTGLPYQERNRTKIIELSFVAINRHDIMRYDGSSSTIPPVSKLTVMLNPQKNIHSSEITGITEDMIKYSPTFKEKFNTINIFLEDLIKPVCLVAHNGNAFDYKILLAECIDVNLQLPDDLLCVDTMSFFKSFFKKNLAPSIKNKVAPSVQPISPSQPPQSPEITDDEDEWPALNVTPEEFQEIDDLCSSMSDTLNLSGSETTMRLNSDGNGKEMLPKTYKLVDIYRKLFYKEPQYAHRAEDDCIMLLQCILVCQKLSDDGNASTSFLTWMDNYSKPLKQITPLQRK